MKVPTKIEKGSTANAGRREETRSRGARHQKRGREEQRQQRGRGEGEGGQKWYSRSMRHHCDQDPEDDPAEK